MKFKPEIFARGWFAAAQSGAQARAVQTLRAVPVSSHGAERLDCGAFTAAFQATKRVTGNLFVTRTTNDAHEFFH